VNKAKHKLRWLAVNVCRIVLAVTFVFSGFVKIVDPKGTQYKFVDYIQAFGWEAWVPEFVPLALAISLAVFEFCVGINMFFGMRRRFTSWLYLLFMLVMTPLTLYLWLTNPVEDCGCFGDAITLTHAETFIKNIVLLLMSWVVFRYFRLMTRFISERNQWTISLYSIVFGLILACVSLYRLPVFDFRPYHVGADLKAAMEIPEGLEGPVYETTFVM
jgi:triosephosphate isomerase